MYKYEMHLHSYPCSACGVSDATDYVKIAHERGFAGMVFTNHFYRGNTGIDRKIEWKKFVGAFRDDYLRAREMGERLDVDVLFGIEEGFRLNGLFGKEALIYGVSPDALMREPEFIHMSISEVSAFVRENGGYIVCAHPFRTREYIQNPDDEPDVALFDAIEVYNAGNSTEDNIKAERFAKKHNIAAISGGDVHRVDSFGKSGLIFDQRAKTEADLVRLLKAAKWKLFAANDNHGDLYEFCK